MRTAQQGDRVQVHYLKRLQDGSTASSRGRPPLEVTVGVEHRRLPGLGLALVGLAPGEVTKLTVPPEQAYGPANAGRKLRLARRRFPEKTKLQPAKAVRVTDNHGRSHLVRIVKLGRKTIIVDTNHRWAGQTMKLKVKLLAIHGPDAESDLPNYPYLTDGVS